MPGTILSTLYIVTYLILTYLCEVGIIIIFILKMNLRLREVKKLGQLDSKRVPEFKLS